MTSLAVLHPASILPNRPSPEDDFTRAQSELRALGGSRLCGQGAAWLLTNGRISLPDPVPLAYAHHVARAGVRQLRLEPVDEYEFQTLPCTSPARTACDLLRGEHRITAIVAVDALLNLCLVSRDEIASELARFLGRRGHPRALARLAETEPNAQSAPETRLRLCLTDGGLPRPAAQLIMLSTQGGFVGRADLGYLLLRLVIEYLGRVHDETLDTDWDRLALARGSGYECVGVTAATMRDPKVAVSRVLDGVRRQQQLLGTTGEFDCYV